METRHPHTPLPATPEGSPIPPESDVTVAQSGLRRFITLARIAWNEETLGHLLPHDHVIRSTPEESGRIRGFRSAPETSDVVPLRPSERINSLHRQGQHKRLMAHRREKYRLTQVHGDQIPASDAIPSVLAEPVRNVTSGDAANWEAVRAKLDAADRGNALSFDTTERMKPSHRGSIERARVYNNILDLAIGIRSERLAKGSEGRSVPGKVRRNRIERVTNRRDRLVRKLNGTN